MCGITGGVWTDPHKGLNAAALAKMTALLRHRGPDGEGSFLQNIQVRPPYESIPGAALGHRRLAVIDLAGGSQPMANEDGSVQIVFNGEIYNFRHLRHRLEGAGHTFRTDCDTEAIVHLYEDEGHDCLRHLVGMFAFAIWDAPRRRLLLARDRLGQKPLYYFHEPGRLLFASELKSLLAAPNVPREIDPNAVDEYLAYQYVPHPNTIFRGIKKLPPGGYAIWQDSALSEQRYWRPAGAIRRDISFAEAAGQVRELLTQSVRLRLQADVPLGAFLSGGIDSSIITALMQQEARRQIKTFSIGFELPQYDESGPARRVAEFLKTDHHEFQVSSDALELLPKLAEIFDEPFGDSSAVPTWRLAELTRRQVTVALSGDGGDELFLGYRRYRAAALAGMLDRLGPVRTLLASKLWQRLPGSGRQNSRLRQWKRFSESLALSPARRYLGWISIFNERRRANLYQDDFLARLADSDPAELMETAWKTAAGRAPAAAPALADLQTYLPCDLMHKVDMATMAHSLECRQPMLDHRLVEFAVSLPHSYHYRRGKGKRLLKAAFAHLLPSEVWKRPKMGFGAPVAEWFRGSLKEMTHDLLLADSAASRTYFRQLSVKQLWEEHQSGRFNHGYRLWSLLMFEWWLRTWG